MLHKNIKTQNCMQSVISLKEMPVEEATEMECKTLTPVLD